MDQLPLFVGAPVVLNVHATHTAGEGWTVEVATRRDGQSWDDARRTQYSHLTTPELFDACEMEIAQQLGLA